MDSVNSKTVPHSLDAEKAVLGCILIDNNSLSSVLEYLSVDSFYDANHRIIFDAMLSLYDNNFKCGEESNLAKLLAADASWEAADMAMQIFGGFSFSEEYSIERKFRETRLYRIAPVSTNMILAYIAHKVLGMPRSY